MLNIVIYEKIKEERDRIKTNIDRLIESNQYKCSMVLSTGNFEEVLEHARNHLKDINAYFLYADLEEDMNGLEVAKEIRRMDMNCYFVFITEHNELSLMTFRYKLRALDCINRDEGDSLIQRIIECMNVIYVEYIKLLEKNGVDSHILTLKSGTRVINIPEEDIVYFETIDDHKLKIRTFTEQIESYVTIKEILSSIKSQGFYRSHKSYIVNTKHIKEINIKERYIQMKNGERCLISRLYAKELIKKNL